MIQFYKGINKLKATEENDNKIFRINATSNSIPQRSRLNEKQRKDLLTEYLNINTPQEFYKPLTDSQENKIDEGSLRVPYMRIRKNNKSPGSKTYIYNADDSFDMQNRFSETRVHQSFLYYRQSTTDHS